MVFKRIVSLFLAILMLLSFAFASAEPDAGTETVPDSPSDSAGVEEVQPDGDLLPESESAEPSDDSPISDGSASGEASEEAEILSWQTPGNTDCEILSGGRMLYTDSGYYSSDGGIWYCTGVNQTFLCADDAMNLNLADGYIYYSIGCEVRRIPCGGGSSETVYTFTENIDELYVIGAEFRFLSGGLVYSYSTASDTLRQLDAPDGVTGLIPTEYGDLFLTGSYPDRSVWTQSACLLTGITRCYTDSGCLVVIRSGQTLQISLESLFSGSTALQSYSLHSGSVSAMSAEDEAAAQQAYFSSSDFQALQDLVDYSADGVYQSYNSSIASTAQSSGLLTQSQRNIITRARQMAEVAWTPLKSISWWTGTTSRADDYAYAADGSVCIGSYAAGKTYQGIPYSQPVYNAGYVGWDISLSDFLKQTQDSSSPLYTETSSAYAGYVGPYYGMDCSGFVSFAWDLSTRRTVAHLRDSDVAENISFSLQNLQVGDTLNREGVHVLLITDLAYDANGNIVSVEVTEQIPPKVRVTCYGEIIPGRSYEYTNSDLSALAAYVNYGYGIFRRNVSTDVTAYDTDAVDLNDAVRDVTVVSGWLEKNGSLYYFDENGNMLTQQWATIDGTRFYFGYTGKLQYSGWLYCLGNWYYYNSDNTMRTDGWLYYGNSWYYFGSDGKMVHGSGNTPQIKEIGSSSYAFSSGGTMMTNTWVLQNGTYYYFQIDGTMLKGSWLKWGSTWYYLDADGKMLCGNSSTPLFADIGTNTYAFNAGGAMLTGWIRQNNTYYYFQSGGAMLKNSWLKWNSSWYYLDAYGKMLCGNSNTPLFADIGTSTYAFNAGGAMLTGWVRQDNTYYYFQSGGAMLKNSWLKWNSSWYYLDAYGKMLCGNSNTPLIAEISGVSYAFNASGAMLANSWLWQNNTYYYFQSGGTMLKNSWLKWGTSWYYLGADGRMYRSYLNDGTVDVEQIGSSRYGFSSGGAMLSNTWGYDSSGVHYYFDSNGVASIVQ